MASLTPTFTGDLSTAITKRALSAYFDWEDRNYISQGKGASRVSGTDPMVGGGGSGGGGRGPINPDIVTRTPFDGLVRRPTINNTNPRSKAVVVQDRALGNFLVAVAISLNSSLNSLNEKSDATTEGIIVAKDGIDKTYKKLEQSSDSLETKLDAIIDALRYSNNQEKVLADERETKSQQAKQAAETDFSTANEILMQDMDREEIRQMQERDIAEDDRGPIVDTPPQNEDQLELPFAGEFAEGGIASGPDSGYLAVLHGDEAVIPLDNNYTQGQPSAVGKQPISDMPMMAERGIMGDNPRSTKPSFTPNVNVSTSLIGSSSTKKDTLAEAIQLPTKAAGLVTMGIMGKVLENFSLPPSVVSGMKELSSPIAKAFGISDVLAGDLASDLESGHRMSEQRSEFKSKNKKNREKNIFQRFIDFITGNRDESGSGGSLYGRGGNTYVNNRASGTGGGIAFFGGKKKEKVYKSKQDFGAILRATAMKDATMVINGFGDPERFKKKYGITAEQFLALPDYPTDQSSLNSNVFTKTVAYNNAFDYNELASPQYGLKTSAIAYNMSMEDEVNSMVDSISDSVDPIVMNNVNSADTGNQTPYSAIAVRGNPLKEGTYVSPYSV